MIELGVALRQASWMDGRTDVCRYDWYEYIQNAAFISGEKKIENRTERNQIKLNLTFSLRETKNTNFKWWRLNFNVTSIPFKLIQMNKNCFRLLLGNDVNLSDMMDCPIQTFFQHFKHDSNLNSPLRHELKSKSHPSSSRVQIQI